MKRTSVFDEVVSAPCAREQCLICPPMRQHPSFSYPEVHLLSLSALERKARLHVDGTFRSEFDLGTSRRASQERRARRFLKGVLERSWDARRRHDLDSRARDRHEALSSAWLELGVVR